MKNATKTSHTYLRTYSLFKSTYTKLMIYEVPITSVMTYVCPPREYVMDPHLLKLQRLQNRTLRAIGNPDKCTPARELHVIHSLTDLSPSWEDTNCAATQELPSILWNPKVQYRFHNSPPLVSILGNINLLDTIPPYTSKISFNIVDRPTSWSS
jgi:hypothetical protein